MKTACVYLDQNNLFFHYKKLDFKKLLDLIKEKYNVTRATAYMAFDSRQEAQKKFITYLSNNGWKCYTVDIQNNTNVDSVILTDMVNDQYQIDHDAVVLISGDKDYSYCLDLLAKRGVEVTVIGPKENTSIDLLKVADQIYYIEDDFSSIILDK